MKLPATPSLSDGQSISDRKVLATQSSSNTTPHTDTKERSDTIRQRILAITKQIQSRAIPLAQCVADALELASDVNNQNLAKFCQLELAGYDGMPSDGKEYSYRLIEVFLSGSARINLGFIGFSGNPSAAFEHMESDTEHFTKKKMLIREPLSQIEGTPRPEKAAILQFKLPYSSLNPNATEDQKGLTLVAYARGDAYANIVEAVRSELTKRILNIIQTEH